MVSVNRSRLLWAATAAVWCVLGNFSAEAMPLHPDVQARLKRGEITDKISAQQMARLHAAGLDQGVRNAAACAIAGGHLDQDFRMLAILVDFSDKASHVAPAFFDTLLCYNRTGTLNNFYREVTYGNLNIISVNMPSALGWKRAPQPYAYYVDGQRGFGDYPQNAQKLAEDAVAVADPYVNFADYDNDGDGYVDGLFIIHAGPGYEYTGNLNDIHSHQWGLSAPMLVDGVYAYVYSMEPEYWLSYGDMTCGVYAHEMGHAVFGFPDLYDYDYDSKGLGKWSLMAGGSWNGTLGASPAHPDAFCRSLMGVVTPTILTTNVMGASLPAIETTPTIYRLWTGGSQTNEYFLVENRRQTGYDAALPSQGLLIYHVDESQYGNNNQWYPGHTTSGNYMVALEQADGLWQLEHNSSSGYAGDPYPGSTTNRSFADATTPNSRNYAGASTLVQVLNISNAATTMTADLYVTMSVTIMAPNGGETKIISEPDTIRWTSSAVAENVNIEWKRNYPDGSWETIVSNTPNDGVQAWIPFGAATTAARIRIVGTTHPNVGDTSHASFTLSTRQLTLTLPNGGEQWFVGDSQLVQWTSQNIPGNVKLDVQRGYPTGGWSTISASTPNNGQFWWAVSAPGDTAVRVRATSISYPTVGDSSNGNFVVSNLIPPVVTVAVNGNDVILRWGNLNLPNYRIYSAATAQGPFTTLEGTTADTTYNDTNALQEGSRKFYLVKSQSQ
jgi:immune inhibitor A